MPKRSPLRVLTQHRPRHAQPSALASLGLDSGIKLGGVAAGLACVLAFAAVQAAAAPAAKMRDGVPVADPTTSVTDVRASAAPLGVALPPVRRLPVRPVATAVPSVPASALAADGIPATALLAYTQAAARVRSLDPACGISWPILAAIGRVESDHGRFAGAVLHTDGLSAPRVIGPALDGVGTALIRDTDHGHLDGDRVYDHAVGPMQFIPSTWAIYGVDVSGHGVADPFNIFDAAAAAARYLCAAGGTLTTLDGQRRAILAYNHSDGYLRLVLALEGVYARGVLGVTVPVLPANPGPVSPPALPPVNPGPPPALAAVKPPHSTMPVTRSSSAAAPSSTPASSTAVSTPDGSSSSASTSPIPSLTPDPTPDPSSSTMDSSSSSGVPTQSGSS